MEYLFSGLKVLDVATVIAAPAAAMMLADFGADVIKVEPPGEGDQLRGVKEVRGQPEQAVEYMWQLDGRNKRGIVLDLKSTEGTEVLRKLVAKCDVYITNQPYSVREKLGLTYEDLQPLNPKMIYASLTAYGEKGAERARKGFDQLAYWARSGLMDLVRGKNATPIQGLSGMGDHPTGVALYAGIVTALLHRERTGEGGMVHTSLLANGLWSNASTTQGVIAGGDAQQFRDRRLKPLAQMNVYRCKDGRWLQLNMVRDMTLMRQMLTAMGASHLMEDERFATREDIREHRVPITAALAAMFLERTSSEWMQIFDEYNVPVNLVAKVEEKATDPQALENNMIVKPTDPEMGIPLLVKHPIQINHIPQVEPKRPPRLSEHSTEILQELGYGDDEIQSLRDKGVI